MGMTSLVGLNVQLMLVRSSGRGLGLKQGVLDVNNVNVLKDQ